MRSNKLFRLLIPWRLLAVLPSRSALRSQWQTRGTARAKRQMDFTGHQAVRPRSSGRLLSLDSCLFILNKYAWPHIKEGLEKREASIRNAHEEAKQDRIDAEAKLVEAKRQLDQAAAGQGDCR